MHSFYRRPSGPAAFLYSVAVALVALAPVRAPAGDDSREFAAARGDRSSGWLAQSRSEVLARNGIVTTSGDAGFGRHAMPMRGSTPR